MGLEPITSRHTAHFLVQRWSPAVGSLDIDNLENIGDLELYIDQSAVIQFFLSKGYFLSRNCVREVVSTIEKKKPLLLVHEADPGKGGAPIEFLRDKECPDECRTPIFDAGRRVTVQSHSNHIAIT